MFKQFTPQFLFITKGRYTFNNGEIRWIPPSRRPHLAPLYMMVVEPPTSGVKDAYICMSQILGSRMESHLEQQQ